MEEQTTNNSGAGDKPEAASVNARVDTLIKRVEEAEARVKAYANEIAELKLGGKSIAGQPQEVVVESAKDYANRIMKNQPIKKV